MKKTKLLLSRCTAVLVILFGVFVFKYSPELSLLGNGTKFSFLTIKEKFQVNPKTGRLPASEIEGEVKTDETKAEVKESVTPIAVTSTPTPSPTSTPLTEKDDKKVVEKEKEKDTHEPCKEKKITNHFNPETLQFLYAPPNLLGQLQDLSDTLYLQQDPYFSSFDDGTEGMPVFSPYQNEYSQFPQFNNQYPQYQQYQQYEQFQQYQEFQKFQQFQNFQQFQQQQRFGQMNSRPQTLLNFDMLDWINRPMGQESTQFMDSFMPRGFVGGTQTPSYRSTPYPLHYTVNNYFGPQSPVMNSAQWPSFSSSPSNRSAAFAAPNSMYESHMPAMPNLMNPGNGMPSQIDMSNRSLADYYNRHSSSISAPANLPTQQQQDFSNTIRLNSNQLNGGAQGFQW